MNIGDDAMLYSLLQPICNWIQIRKRGDEELLIMSVVISTVNFLNY